MAAVNLILLVPAIIMSSLFDLTSQDEYSSGNHHLLDRLREAKLKVTRLESSLEQVTQSLKAKDLHIQKLDERVRDTERKINHLQLTLSNLKSGSLLIDEKIKALEEEIRVLWATSRKYNFDIHVIQSQAQEAEERLKIMNSQVNKMADIVSEQWIQIQQFEQALQLRQMTMLKAQRRVRSSKCSFLKFMNDLSAKYLPKSLGPLDSHSFGSLRSYKSEALNLLSRLYSSVKAFHYELQGLIRREMERHEFTARFVHEELVFFVASVLIIFPVFSAWILLSHSSTG